MDNTDMTAAELSAMQDVRFNHCRFSAQRFLSETDALSLHVELAHFLSDIYNEHQKEIKRLEEVISAMVLASNK